MARFEVRLTSTVSADEAWRRVWDLDAHSRVIPLTTLTGDGTDGDDLHTGSRFTARTGIGPIRVDDVMRLTRFDRPHPTVTTPHGTGTPDTSAAPNPATPSTTAADTTPPTARREGHAHVVKEGTMIRGDIDAHVRPAPGGSVLTWRQTITLRGVPAPLDPVIGIVARLAYGRVLRQLLDRPTHGGH